MNMLGMLKKLQGRVTGNEVILRLPRVCGRAEKQEPRQDVESSSLPSSETDEDIENGAKLEQLLDRKSSQDLAAQQQVEEASDATGDGDGNFQSRGEEKYLIFDGEAEEDYTAGPARMVFANDGVRECAALLMKLDLSAKIQEAVKAQRDLSVGQSHAEEQIKEIESFERTLMTEIRNHRYRLAGAEEIESGDRAEVVASLKEKINILRTIHQSMELKELQIQRNLERQANALHEASTEVVAYLDSIFFQANLIEEHVEQTSQIQRFDLQEEYQKAVRASRGDDDGACSHMVEPLETGSEFMRPKRPAVTPEQQLEIDTRNAVYLANERLQNAQQDFDGRDWEQAHDLERRRRALIEDNKTTDSVRTEFDLLWVQRNRDLTHELVEAEKCLAEAKAAAKEAKIDVSDQGSSYGGNASEISFAVNSEEAAAYVTPQVDKWLAAIDEVASTEAQSLADVDDWQCREVEMWDSASCVDNDFYRKEIDQWQQACSAESPRKL